MRLRALVLATTVAAAGGCSSRTECNSRPLASHANILAAYDPTAPGDTAMSTSVTRLLTEHGFRVRAAADTERRIVAIRFVEGASVSEWRQAEAIIRTVPGLAAVRDGPCRPLSP